MNIYIMRIQRWCRRIFTYIHTYTVAKNEPPQLSVFWFHSLIQHSIAIRNFFHSAAVVFHVHVAGHILFLQLYCICSCSMIMMIRLPLRDPPPAPPHTTAACLQQLTPGHTRILVAPWACVRVYARVMVPPKLYITYIRRGPVCACTRVCWCRQIFTYIHTLIHTKEDFLNKLS